MAGNLGSTTKTMLNAWGESPYTTGAMGAAAGMGRSAGYFEGLSGGWTAENVMKAHPIVAKFFNSDSAGTYASMLNRGVKNFGMRQSADIYQDQGSLYSGLSGYFSNIMQQGEQIRLEREKMKAQNESNLWGTIGSILGTVGGTLIGGPTGGVVGSQIFSGF